ncbi:MAG: hypothetical protein RL090_443 [Bacteroidota bacterium]|jgi:glycosyltransferase involved in cell wall biosynthesis
MLHIGFDAKRLLFNRSGLGNYSRAIVRALALHTSETKLTLLSPKSKSDWAKSIAIAGIDPESVCENIELVSPSFAPFWWRSKGMGSTANQSGVDVFHGLSNEIPFDLPRRIRKVCTIHDLIFIDHPRNYPWLDRNIYRRKVEFALRNCDAIIATSVFTKDSILFHYPETQVPIHVVYQPVHPLFNSSESKKTSSEKPYFIYHSGFNKRKNHLRLLEAFKSVKQSISQNLMLVGIKGDTYDEVNTWVTRNEMTERVILKTDVETPELVKLLSCSDGFIYPSLMEGFGIPLAEAAVMGLNAAVSDIPVFNELSNGGFITFDPIKVESIAHALVSLASLDETAKNQQRTARSKVVELTNSQTIANQLMAIYKDQHTDAS